MATLKITLELEINIPTEDFLEKLQSVVLQEFRDELEDYTVLEYTEETELDIDDHWEDSHEWDDWRKEQLDFAHDDGFWDYE